MHRKLLLSVFLYNEYGPTEATIWSTVYDTTSYSGTGTVPIGVPNIRTQAYILDQQLEPVPVGAPGELDLGGAGVGRGYVHMADRTAQVFLPSMYQATSV